MKSPIEFLNFLHSRLRREVLDRDMDAEMELHVASRRWRVRRQRYAHPASIRSSLYERISRWCGAEIVIT